jgi:hypothetical protein
MFNIINTPDSEVLKIIDFAHWQALLDFHKALHGQQHHIYYPLPESRAFWFKIPPTHWSPIIQQESCNYPRVGQLMLIGPASSVRSKDEPNRPIIATFEKLDEPNITKI